MGFFGKLFGGEKAPTTETEKPVEDVVETPAANDTEETPVEETPEEPAV